MEDITIPKGYEAKIEGDKVIFERKNEEEVIRKEIISLVRRYVLPEANCLVPGGCTTRKNAIAYLERQKEQNPAKWSEEDEIRLKEALEVLDESIKHLPIGYGYTKDVRHVKDWLESLRPQPGLSKEDFIKFGNREYERGRQDGIQFAERFRWKPGEDGIQQPHWKPREDHFQGLRRGIMKVEKGSDAWNSLTDLYEQLEKL